VRYSIKNDRRVSYQGVGLVIAVLPTVEAVPDEVGVMIDIFCDNNLGIKLAVQPSDFDDEASSVQLVRLAERIQLMATAALNRRALAGGGVS
jgi:hypothetical protein